MVFGGITIVCGIFGTLAGGYVLDRMQSTISNAFKVTVTNKPMKLQLYLMVGLLLVQLSIGSPSTCNACIIKNILLLRTDKNTRD